MTVRSHRIEPFQSPVGASKRPDLFISSSNVSSLQQKSLLRSTTRLISTKPFVINFVSKIADLFTIPNLSCYRGYPEEAERYPHVMCRHPRSVNSLCLSATGQVQRILILCRDNRHEQNHSSFQFFDLKCSFKGGDLILIPMKVHRQMTRSRISFQIIFQRNPIQSHLHSSNPDPVFTTLTRFAYCCSIPSNKYNVNL